MKLQQKFWLADRYNRPDTIIVVASFPGRHDHSIANIDAVASYTEHFTASFRKELAKSGKKLVLLVQKIEAEEWYEEKDMLICRVWDKGSPLCYLQILTALMFFKAVPSVLVQFEFHQFGGNFATATFPVFLAMLRLTGKLTTLVMHQVVSDIESLSGHINIARGSLRASVFNFALRSFYKLSGKLAQTIVVHSEILKNRLAQITGRTDLSVIPHGLGAIRQRFTKRRARAILNLGTRERVIICFGFLTWYKGADWLVKTFVKSRRDIQLIVAGGASPNLKDQLYYQAYVKELTEMAKSSKRIRLTGFVEDKDIPLYFAAADLVVLPYRTLLSASGPLAMAIAFKRPFIFSHALSPYTQDADFSKSLRETQLTAEALSFNLSEKDFWHKAELVLAHNRKFLKLARSLYAARTWPTVAARFAEVIAQTALAHAGKSAIMHRNPFFTYAPQ